MKKLAVDWWIRERHETKFRKALNWGFADHCYTVIENGFESNKQRGRWPASWNSYVAAISMASDGNLKRKRSGDNATQIHECLGIASLVDTTPQNLPPPNCKSWLLAAILYLCEDVSLKNAEIFVAYCVQQLERHRELQAGLANRDRLLFVELSLKSPDIEEVSEALAVDVEHARLAVAEVKRRLEECL
jgi:hypothetical protein